MAIYKRNKIWYIDYFYEGRRIREAVGSSKKLAQKALMIRKTQITQGKFDIQDTKPSITFGELAKTYIEYAKVNKKSWKRDVVSLNKLLPFFENRQLKHITPFLVEQYKQQRREEVSPATVNRELALVKHMFTLAIKWKRASNNPVKEVKFFRERNQRLRFLSEEEIHRLIESCEPNLKAIVITAITTGMRRSEIFGLKWQDVDLERKQIILDETKSGVSRKMPINDALNELLLNLKSRVSHEYVFLNRFGKPYKDVKTSFKTALRKAGIEGATFHTLRHTFASHLVMSNVNLRTVQELLGHKSFQMTMRYSHLSEEYKERAVNILQRRLRLSDSHKYDTKKETEEKSKSVKN